MASSTLSPAACAPRARSKKSLPCPTPPPAVGAPGHRGDRAAFPDLDILKLFGACGMGAVYEARQPQLDRTVALKILSHELLRELRCLIDAQRAES